jgi:hypothetical protein
MNETIELIEPSLPMTGGKVIEQPRSEVTVTTPEQVLSMAIQRGATIDQMERMMALAERMRAQQVEDEQRESVRRFNAAFAGFKTETVKVIRNRGFAGPLAGKKYADLFSLVDAATEPLARHGLSCSWKTTRDDKDWIEVTCTLKHSGGHFETVAMGGPPDTGGAKNMLQARFSTTTYLERRTMKAILGLADQDEDDDGAGGAQDAGQSPLQDWIGKAQDTTDEAALNAVVRGGVAAFSRDKKSYNEFGAAVAKHRAFIKQASQQEGSHA